MKHLNNLQKKIAIIIGCIGILTSIITSLNFIINQKVSSTEYRTDIKHNFVKVNTRINQVDSIHCEKNRVVHTEIATMRDSSLSIIKILYSIDENVKTIKKQQNHDGLLIKKLIEISPDKDIKKMYELMKEMEKLSLNYEN